VNLARRLLTIFVRSKRPFAEGQNSSEDKNCEDKPTQPKTNSSFWLSITLVWNFWRFYAHRDSRIEILARNPPNFLTTTSYSVQEKDGVKKRL